MVPAKFRARPVIVEAVRYTGLPPHPSGLCFDCCFPALPAHIHTRDNILGVNEGDWIVTGIEGERYTCTPCVFAATYEPAE